MGWEWHSSTDVSGIPTAEPYQCPSIEATSALTVTPLKAAIMADPRLHARIPESQHGSPLLSVLNEQVQSTHPKMSHFSPGEIVFDAEDVVLGTSPCLTLMNPPSPMSGDFTIDSSSSCAPPDPRPPTILCSNKTSGTLASDMYEGWHDKSIIDLTLELKSTKPNIPFTKANTFWHMEFIPALLLLRKHINNLPGGEYFWKQLRYRPHPGLWTVPGKDFPPRHKSSNTMVKAFGYSFHCDHMRSSGCPVKMMIKREYNMNMEKDIYSVSFSKGEHLMACNHIRSYNRTTKRHYPALHPVVDMFIRKQVESTKHTRHHLVLSDIQEVLKQHMMTVTALHCMYPHANDDYVFAKLNDDYKTCCHRLNYKELSSMSTLPNSAKMPPTAKCTPRVSRRSPLRKGTTLQCSPSSVNSQTDSTVPYERTVRAWSTLDHMFVKDGHSVNGNHQFEDEQLTQMRKCLAAYNREIRDDNVISESTTASSGVGPVHACFKDQNLFARWEKMVSNDPKLHKNLSLFEWNQIGLLYRKRTPEEIKEAVRQEGDEQKTREEGDFPEQSDPRNLPYEFVSVYASLFSLICGVKAWACRKVTGRVQVSRA